MDTLRGNFGSTDYDAHQDDYDGAEDETGGDLQAELECAVFVRVTILNTKRRIVLWRRWRTAVPNFAQKLAMLCYSSEIAALVGLENEVVKHFNLIAPAFGKLYPKTCDIVKKLVHKSVRR